MITVRVVLLVLQASTRQLMATELALTVQRTRLQLAMGLRRSHHVRVMRGTMAMLRQGHAVRARLAGTRLLAVMEMSRMMSAMRVQRTHLLLALGLRRSLIVRAV